MLQLIIYFSMGSPPLVTTVVGEIFPHYVHISTHFIPCLWSRKLREFSTIKNTNSK